MCCKSRGEVSYILNDNSRHKNYDCKVNFSGKFFRDLIKFWIIRTLVFIPKYWDFYCCSFPPLTSTKRIFSSSPPRLFNSFITSEDIISILPPAGFSSVLSWTWFGWNFLKYFLLKQIQSHRNIIQPKLS